MILNTVCYRGFGNQDRVPVILLVLQFLTVGYNQMVYGTKFKATLTSI